MLWGITRYAIELKCGRSSGVERNLAKVDVVSSNLIARSIFLGILRSLIWCDGAERKIIRGIEVKPLIIIVTLVLSSLMLAAYNSPSNRLSVNIGPTKQDCQELAMGAGALLIDADKFWDELRNIPENSADTLEPAAKIKWLTDIAANYSVYYETFCK